MMICKICKYGLTMRDSNLCWECFSSKMTELKTLKDLKVSSKNPMFNIGSDTQRYELRLESIKHIKEVINARSVIQLIHMNLTHTKENNVLGAI